MAALQYGLMSIASFIVVLGVVVFVHEFGHFQAARWRKVAIDTFSIGFGKSLLSWRDKKGVVWKIGAIPLGGYVKFSDDADGISMGPREQVQDPVAKAEARKRGMFHAQSLLTRSIVVAAGPLTNFIFAIAAFAAFILITGKDVTDYGAFPAQIGAVKSDSAAHDAGMRVGDVVTAINGQPVSTWVQFQQTVSQNGVRPMQLTIAHGGETRAVSVTPRVQSHVNADGSTSRSPILGVQLDPDALPHQIERVGPVEAVDMGARLTWSFVAQTGTYLGGMITGRNSGEEIAGPLGILAASGRTTADALSVPSNGPLGAAGVVALSLLFLAARISVAVGLANLLPIPILDGGHLFFYLIEAVRRGRPLPPVAQEWAFRAGLAVMASLFLFATWNDVTRHLWSQG